jgi:hypothetical protein
MKRNLLNLGNFLKLPTEKCREETMNNIESCILPFETKISQIQIGYGMDVFDFSRRLSSENRENVIDILKRLEMLIRSKEYNEEKWADTWECLMKNVSALKASEDAECAANIFNSLMLIAPPSKVREIHRG